GNNSAALMSGEYGVSCAGSAVPRTANSVPSRLLTTSVAVALRRRRTRSTLETTSPSIKTPTPTSQGTGKRDPPALGGVSFGKLVMASVGRPGPGHDPAQARVP